MGVVGVKARVMGTDDLPATRSVDEIAKDTECTCPEIAGNVNSSCVCNGEPVVSNVEMLTLAVATDIFEFVSPMIEHTIGIMGATGDTAIERFKISRPDGSVMLAVV